jgi:hypothetical protein
MVHEDAPEYHGRERPRPDLSDLSGTWLALSPSLSMAGNHGAFSLMICLLHNWLVVWNMNFICPYMGNIVIPTDELIFFTGVQTTNQ